MELYDAPPEKGGGNKIKAVYSILYKLVINVNLRKNVLVRIIEQ